MLNEHNNVKQQLVCDWEQRCYIQGVRTDMSLRSTSRHDKQNRCSVLRGAQSAGHPPVRLRTLKDIRP